MNYQEYEKAAQRHQITCCYLINKISNKAETISPIDKNRILLNVYYLTGYVIESVVSYAFFKVIKYDLNKSVYDFNDHNIGISFHRDFKEHSQKSNQRKVDIIRQLGGEIPSTTPLIGEDRIDEKLKLMYIKWDSKIRYSDMHLGFDLNYYDAKEFLNLALKIYSNLRRL